MRKHVIERANRANSWLATRAQGVGESDTRGNRRSYKEELVTADQKTEDDVATTGKVEHTYIRANEL
jgi:hypothetical protein